MNRYPRTVRTLSGFAAIALLIGGIAVAGAEDLDGVLDAGERGIQLAQASQGRIDEVVRETREMEARYRQIVKETDGLRVYNEYMGRQVANQTEELARLRASIDQVSIVERQIMPLMIRMIESLEQFIELDVPFLYEERVARAAGLRNLMERADVSVSEKFRRLTEAYQIENEFGRTIEAYPGTLVIDGVTLEVDILRLGRIGLYYQSRDAAVTGRWDPSTREWAKTSGSEVRNQVRRGLKIARKQQAPDLLLLPVERPEVVR